MNLQLLVALSFIRVSESKIWLSEERDTSLNNDQSIEFYSTKSRGHGAKEIFKVRSILERYRAKLREQLSGTPLPLSLVLQRGMGTQVRKKRKPEISKDRNQMDSSREEMMFVNAPDIPEINHRLRDYLYQGDMVLTVEQAEQLMLQQQDDSSDSLRQRRQAQNWHNFPTVRWDREQIPFIFSKNLSNKTKDAIKKALTFWGDNTCLSFLEIDHEGAHAYPNKIRFFQGMISPLPPPQILGPGCYSSVGKTPEPLQSVSIGKDCDRNLGTIAHEIAHALGFFHSQSRYDRDQYVKINEQNLAEECLDQFSKEDRETSDNYALPYDYGSVMHYNKMSCSKDGIKPVLIANQPHNQDTMGQRMQPSFLDILLMNKHYECFDYCNGKATAKCKNQGFVHPRNCSRCICPGGFGGALCNERQASSSDEANCGETIEAAPSWTELNEKVGNDVEKMRPEFSSCHWHIIAPQGRRVRLKILELGPGCSPACIHGSSEFKISANVAKTGLRMCCSADLEPEGVIELVTEDHFAVISLYSDYFHQKFRVHFKYE